jgi:ankyrin repeat protein
MRIIVISLLCLLGLAGAAPANAESLIDEIRKADNQYDARSDIRSSRYDHVAARIAEGDGIGERGVNGKTPLHMAASNNDIDITLDLLEKGADPYALDDNGMSAISDSMYFGRQTFHILLDYYVRHKKFPADFDAYVKTSSVLDRAFSNESGIDAFELLLAYDVALPDTFIKHAEWEMKQRSSPLKERRFKKMQGHLARKKAGEKLPPPPAAPGHMLIPPEEDPPLITAVRGGDAKAVQALLEKGDNPDQISAYYAESFLQKIAGGRDSARFAARPALSLALLLGHKDIAKLLLEHGASPSLRGASYHNYGQDSCETPLILAVKSGDREMIELLLAKGADINGADCQWGKTPLAYAGDLALVDLLLKKGADVNRGGRYVSPLVGALQDKNKQLLAHLLEKGGNANQVQPGWHGETLLHKAAADPAYDSSYIQLLLEHGADAKLKDDEGFTAYDVAVAKGRKDIAALLLENGGISGNASSVMMGAIGRGDLETMEKLLKGGLDPNNPPYVYSIANNARYAGFVRKPQPTLAMVQLLAKYGANLKVTGENATSLMHMAQDGGMVDYLASQGVDISPVDMWRTTPLHTAANEGNVSVVTALLKHGADPTLKNGNGSTPLALALGGPPNRMMADGPPTDWQRESPPYFDVIRLLAAAGADPEAAGMPFAFGQRGEDYNRFREQGMDIARKSYKPRAAPAAGVKPPAPRPVVAAQDIYLLFRMVSERFINKYDVVRWQTGKDPAATCNIDVMGAAQALFDANRGYAKDFAAFIDSLRLRGQHSLMNIDGTGALPPAQFQAPNLLHVAAFYKDLPVMKALLAKGADASVTDSAGNTALHYATQGYSTGVQSTLAAIDMLLAAGVPVNARNIEGETALLVTGFKAIGGKMTKSAQMEIIERLLEKGADPKITRNDGYSLADNAGAVLASIGGLKPTEFVEAQTQGYRSLLEMLEKLGLPRDKWRQSSGQQPQTPLQEAVGRLDLAEVKALVAGGADVNEGSYTPLMSAAGSGDRGVDIARLLLDKGARLDRRTSPYETVLSRALQQPEHGDMVDLLLSRGLKPAPADLMGFYSGTLTQRGKESLRKILDTGVDPNACDASGESPLYKAAQRGNAEAVEILLSYGARVDYCTKDPRESGTREPVKGLLDGAMPSEEPSIRPKLAEIWSAARDCRIHGAPE